ncbi:unnamed protein product, partial [Ascophyllum nodosum]
ELSSGQYSPVLVCYKILSRSFVNSTIACVRLDDRACLGWFAVEQGLRQGCVLTPLLFNIIFAAVINDAFQGGQRRHGRF